MKMAENRQFPALTIHGNIDKRTFFRFAVFDSLVRKKAWRNPLLFALIMSAFATVCFMGRGRHEQAGLIGGVLLGIGLLLPLVWFGMFFASVNRQAKLNGLSAEKTQYTVTLSPEKIASRVSGQGLRVPLCESDPRVSPAGRRKGGKGVGASHGSRRAGENKSIKSLMAKLQAMKVQ